MEAAPEGAPDSPTRGRSDRWADGGAGSGPASLGNPDGSPGLEYDLWEGQFQFLGPQAARPPHQQVSLARLPYI